MGTLTRLSYPYNCEKNGDVLEPVPYENRLQQVMELKRSGDSWHFHMIAPACTFSNTKDRFEIMVEIEATGETIRSQFLEKPIDETHQLAKLVYGDDFLKKHSEHTPSGSIGELADGRAAFSTIMDRAHTCCAEGTAWHNHHLPPHCRFNPQKDRHCIVFEDEIGGEPLYAFYQSDPVGDLAELERLFFNK